MMCPSGTGVDWLGAFKHIVTNPIEAFTIPNYKLEEPNVRVLQCAGSEGKIVRGQPTELEKSEGSLGLVFTANVFGHYVLMHEIMGLLEKGSAGGEKFGRARVVWVSSVEALDWTLDLTDMQHIAGVRSYESSKRLTDVLALTYDSAEAVQYTSGSFLRRPEDKDGEALDRDGEKEGLTYIRIPPRFFVTHPAICATAISGLIAPMWYLMLFMFYFTRVVLGSEWHPISTWKGNSANMYVALASEEEVEQRGAEGIKWGAGCDRWGSEVVIPTPVKGLDKGEEEKAGFLGLGRECWRRMEELRFEWMKRLEAPVGVALR